MRALWMVAAGVCFLAGCADERADPNDLMLLGTWGSDDALFIALRSGAELQLACTVVIVDEPISLEAGDTFVLKGRLMTSTAVIGHLPRIRGRGMVEGGRVSLSLPMGPQGASVVFDLTAGVTPQRTELPTCPQ
jgi:hypothetical protein